MSPPVLIRVSSWMHSQVHRAEKLLGIQCNELYEWTVFGFLPVSLAYAGDVNETKREKDAEIGLLVGISMLGSTGGGIIAILMQTQGLFLPLLIGAAFSFVAAVMNTFMLIEPRDILASRSREREEMGLLVDIEDDEDAIKAPTELQKKVFGVFLPS